MTRKKVGSAILTVQGSPITFVPHHLGEKRL